MTTTKPNQKPKIMVQNVSCILPQQQNLGGVFVGNVYGAQNPTILKEYGIRAVLTLSIETEINYTIQDIPFHLKIQAHDKQDYNLKQHINQCIHFIEQARKYTNVFIHCFAGVSRSVAIVCSYIMWKFKWNYQTTIAFMRAKRVVSKPNQGFIKQLLEIQQILIEVSYSNNNIQSNITTNFNNVNMNTNMETVKYNEIRQNMKQKQDLKNKSTLIVMGSNHNDNNNLKNSPKISIKQTLSSVDKLKEIQSFQNTNNKYNQQNIYQNNEQILTTSYQSKQGSLNKNINNNNYYNSNLNTFSSIQVNQFKPQSIYQAESYFNKQLLNIPKPKSSLPYNNTSNNIQQNSKDISQIYYQSIPAPLNNNNSFYSSSFNSANQKSKTLSRIQYNQFNQAQLNQKIIQPLSSGIKNNSQQEQKKYTATQILNYSHSPRASQNNLLKSMNSINEKNTQNKNEGQSLQIKKQIQKSNNQEKNGFAFGMFLCGSTENVSTNSIDIQDGTNIIYEYNENDRYMLDKNYNTQDNFFKGQSNYYKKNNSDTNSKEIAASSGLKPRNKITSLKHQNNSNQKGSSLSNGKTIQLGRKKSPHPNANNPIRNSFQNKIPVPKIVQNTQTNFQNSKYINVNSQSQANSNSKNNILSTNLSSNNNIKSQKNHSYTQSSDEINGNTVYPFSVTSNNFTNNYNDYYNRNSIYNTVDKTIQSQNSFTNTNTNPNSLKQKFDFRKINQKYQIKNNSNNVNDFNNYQNYLINNYDNINNAEKQKQTSRCLIRPKDLPGYKNY